MTRDAEATKQRILAAAIAEFAARGAAGARIDRIAALAVANKQLIYAYFGSKQGLFDAAVEDQVRRFHDEVPFDPACLADFAVAAYDFFVAQPALARLAIWHTLEESQQDHPIQAIVNLWRERTRAIARAQNAGVVTDALRAPDLLLLLLALARAWIVTTPEARDAARADNARRRRGVYEAARRLVAVPPASDIEPV